MAKLKRDEQLVRASKARAAIVGFLNQQTTPEPVTQDALVGLVEPLGVTPVALGNILYQMAGHGLIAKHAITEHDRYRVGYTAKGVTPAVTEAAAPRKYTKKTAVEGAPIDVRVNEREGIITIRYAGMVISLSKE